jgi:tRNA dimethylallyltransferase
MALIAGPTASGKSALAVALAHALHAAGQDAVIINADASQVYADIPILSARPTEREMAGISHRLFGHIDGAQACDAARWASEAKAEIAAAHTSGAIPILVGGTGLYISTLLNGIAPIPAVDAAVRAEVRALPVSAAYAALRSEDPHAAARLKPQDKARIARALEVVRSSGTPLNIWQTRLEGGIAGAITLSPLLLLPPRAELYARCDARLAEMFEGGAVAEVQRLLERRLPPTLPVMTAIGVPQIAAALSGEFMLEAGMNAALSLSQRATRHYAKRQFTWFRNQFPEAWPRVEAPLNHAYIDNIAIKLRDSVLTA